MTATLLDSSSGGAVTPCVGTAPYRYGVYGVALHSEIPLNLPINSPSAPLGEIELRTAPPDWFFEQIRGTQLHQSPDSWYQHARLPNRASYARWEGVGEFLVSPDGATIFCHQAAAEASSESFHVYLLGQALSFALVKQGFEPLHATTIVVNGEAIALLGEGGFGKSTLAACFLAAGHRVLTDDLLLARQAPHGILAYPGPPRIKLFPRTARRFLGAAASGVPMNTATRKMILPLDTSRVRSTPAPLRAIYALSPPRTVFRKQSIQIERLSPREAFLALVKNTFNYRITDAQRLQRQFQHTSHLAGSVPVFRLAHPRSLDRLEAVRDRILELCWDGCAVEEAVCAG